MSGTDRPSSGFDQLAEPVRKWIYRQKWTSLREVQESAIQPVLDSRDLVIASATASGKTEAAFLPLLSRLYQHPTPGLDVLYVSPLKALINDQARRLEVLAESIDLPVTPWHGDVPESKKKRLREKPAGILLITPESLEAMFVLRGSSASVFFSGLQAIVIDELHSFIGAERGRQLQSLLHRVDLVTGDRVQRIGLSATLGDLNLAADFLRPGADRPPMIIESTRTIRDVHLQVRGYEVKDGAETTDEASPDRMERDLFKVVRSGTHIVFTNSRATVEKTVDGLKTLAAQESIPDRFWPHHGNLAKEVREDAESALRSTKDATVVATTTLELGIDVGSVDSIAQIGPPPSVSSIRQRLGRSGRRAGDPSVLRIYASEGEISPRTPPHGQLRDSLVQSIAMITLLVERFNEAPEPGSLHLSTLVQQVLSLTAQRGAVRANDSWRALCDTGPFENVSADLFGGFLRDLGERELLSQMGDGTLTLGIWGERLVNNYDFYSAFLTSDEFRLVSGARTLGTLPISRPLAVGDFILFAGQRWEVLEVRTDEKLIQLNSAPAGRAPTFAGSRSLVDDAVRTRMFEVLDSDHSFSFIDETASRLLDQARTAFRNFDLNREPILTWGDDVVLFPWIGDRTQDSMTLMLRYAGLRAATDGHAILLEGCSRDAAKEAIAELVAWPPDPEDIVGEVANMESQKFHRFLSDSMLERDWISSRLDCQGAIQVFAKTV